MNYSKHYESLIAKGKDRGLDIYTEGKEGGSSAMGRWHFNNCKLTTKEFL